MPTSFETPDSVPTVKVLSLLRALWCQYSRLNEVDPDSEPLGELVFCPWYDNYVALLSEDAKLEFEELADCPSETWDAIYTLRHDKEQRKALFTKLTLVSRPDPVSPISSLHAAVVVTWADGHVLPLTACVAAADSKEATAINDELVYAAVGAMSAGIQEMIATAPLDSMYASRAPVVPTEAFEELMTLATSAAALVDVTDHRRQQYADILRILRLLFQPTPTASRIHPSLQLECAEPSTAGGGWQ